MMLWCNLGSDELKYPEIIIVGGSNVKIIYRSKEEYKNGEPLLKQVSSLFFIHSGK